MDENNGGAPLVGGEPQWLFFVGVDADFKVHYPNDMNEIMLRGWLDKCADGIKDSLKMRALIARK